VRVALGARQHRIDDQADSTGLSRISALKAATHNLLNMLQGPPPLPAMYELRSFPSARPSLQRFQHFSWIDWTDWDSPSGSMPSSPPAQRLSGGSRAGYTCTSGPANGSSSVFNVPSAALPGYMRTKVDGGAHSYLKNHYYNVFTTAYRHRPQVIPSTTVCTNLKGCTTTTYCIGYPQSSSDQPQVDHSRHYMRVPHFRSEKDLHAYNHPSHHRRPTPTWIRTIPAPGRLLWTTRGYDV
jgi:hypothetical protein